MGKLSKPTLELIAAFDSSVSANVVCHYRCAHQLQACFHFLRDQELPFAALNIYRGAMETALKGLWWILFAKDFESDVSARESLAISSLNSIAKLVDEAIMPGGTAFWTLLNSTDTFLGLQLLNDVLHPSAHGHALVSGLVAFASGTSQPRIEVQLSEAFDQVMQLFTAVFKKHGGTITQNESTEFALVLEFPELPWKAVK